MADKTTRERRLLLLSQFAYLASARVDERLRHFIGELRGGCAVAHGVGKHVKIGEGAFLQKLQTPRKFVLSLTGKTNNQVCAEGRVRQGLTQPGQHVACERAVVAPAHTRQDHIVSGLQRDMKVRTECFRLRQQLHEGVTDLVRINGTQTHAWQRLALLNRFQQPGQVNSRVEIVSVSAEVDAGQNDLLKALVGQAVELL